MCSQIWILMHSFVHTFKSILWRKQECTDCMMHGLELELTFHCVCVCVVWAVCLSFIRVGHVGCVRLTVLDWSQLTPHPSPPGEWHFEVEHSLAIIRLRIWSRDGECSYPRRVYVYGVNDQGYSLDMVMFPSWYWSLINTSTWILDLIPRNHHDHCL